MAHFLQNGLTNVGNMLKILWQITKNGTTLEGWRQEERYAYITYIGESNIKELLIVFLNGEIKSSKNLLLPLDGKKKTLTIVTSSCTLAFFLY